MNNRIRTIFLLSLAFFFTMSPACNISNQGNIQAQSLVIDAGHNIAKGVHAFFSLSSALIKKVIESPAWEKISKVQQFLQDASKLISTIVKNLKMTKELIAIEQEIFSSLTAYYQTLDDAEDFPSKYIHHRTLVQLWYEAGQIFEVFDFATIQNRGIINDEGRILLIRDALIKAKQIKKAMRTAMKRANRDLLVYKRSQQEVESFINFFGFE